MEHAATASDATGCDFFDRSAGRERFPALAAVPGLWHTFTLRAPDVEVAVERSEAIARLQPHFASSLHADGRDLEAVWMGEQVHGTGLAVCEGRPPLKGSPLSDCDGLLTGATGTLIGVMVADCCAVYLVDEGNQACGLVHSGKRGTELGIVPKAIEEMSRNFGTIPGNLVVQLSPCIRPPAYEIDFAAQIRAQCREAGVAPERIHDGGACTHQRVDRYYSYRREAGHTGRMLAVLGWEAEGESESKPGKPSAIVS